MWTDAPVRSNTYTAHARSAASIIPVRGCTGSRVMSPLAVRTVTGSPPTASV
jgi:hypothetical protein